MKCGVRDSVSQWRRWTEHETIPPCWRYTHRLGVKATTCKAKAKDLASEAKAKSKDLTFKAEGLIVDSQVYCGLP